MHPESVVSETTASNIKGWVDLIIGCPLGELSLASRFYRDEVCGSEE